MSVSRFAAIADVHGNAWALEAVLADIARRNVSTVLNLGDNANGPLDPLRSVALLREHCTAHVRGNGDRMTAEGGPSATKSAFFARERLDAQWQQWLRDLPLIVRGSDWAAFHASPRSDVDYVMENLCAGKPVLASASEISDRVGETSDASLLLCGHTHIPRLVRLNDGRVVVNPGSVGLPAYKSDDPSPHSVETGSPHARYAVVERLGRGWHVEFISVDYDYEAAAATAKREGWNAWAKNLETGYV
jgi:predicted phosphodiesterase